MKANVLLGAICGDVIGSIYEGRTNIYKNKSDSLLNKYCHFTDDTVLTCAIAEWLTKGNDVRTYLRMWGHKHPHAGYGKAFKGWFMTEETNVKLDSWGNGSAMRVSPVGWISDSLEETLQIAKESAEWTHNHEEGIKGAQATSACIWLARHGKSKEEIKKYIEDTFGYDLNRTVEELKKTYTFSSWCQTSVPESIICFLDGENYEDTIKNAMILNGDVDTMAAISGAIAYAYYQDIPQELVDFTLDKLTNEMKVVLTEFEKLIN